MQENKIDQQRFDAIAELSQIEMKLSDARVAFENLKKAEEEYLVSRETKVVERLNNLTATLETAFASFLENKDTFETIKAIVSEFSNKAMNIAAEIKEVSGTLQSKISTVDNYISTKMSDINSKSNQIIEERKNLNEELSVFSKRMAELINAEKSLNEAKQKFSQNWENIQ